MSKDPGQVLDELYAVLLERKAADPKTSYVAGLYAKGPDAILKKIGEEAAETLLAAKNLAGGLLAAKNPAGGGNKERAALVHELADLWFHTLVLMAAYDLPISALADELARRSGRSGLEEKAARAKQQEE